jgi:serine protease
MAIRRRHRQPLAAATVALACGVLAGGGSAVAAPTTAPAVGPAFEPGEVLVRFRGETTERAYELPGRVGVREATRSLRRNPAVRWAVPNYIAHASGAGWVPNDPGRKTFPEGGWRELQWHFLPCGSSCGGGPGGEEPESFGGIDAPRAWRNLIQAGRPGARGVKVAVVDTGVAYRNRGKRFRRSPDLKRRQFTAARDYIDGDRFPLDENGHGTHVASTIGERTDNRKFVTGLAYGAKLIPVRVLDERGSGKASQVAKVIRWAYRHGADVINLSLEFPRAAVKSCTDIPSVCTAIDKAHTKGVVVTGAAGNPANGPRSEVAYPALAPFVIATGGTTERGCLANYSNWGAGLDLVAPGGGRDTPMAGPQCDPAAEGRGISQLTLRKGVKGFTSFGYPSYKGTSMASAHLAGVAALVWAALEERLDRAPTPDEVESRLESTARDDRGLRDGQRYGAGLVDAAAATDR